MKRQRERNPSLWPINMEVFMENMYGQWEANNEERKKGFEIPVAGEMALAVSYIRRDPASAIIL